MAGPSAPFGATFDRLRDACAEPWAAYTDHAFVRGLGDATLPQAAFKRYLVQDYIFLIHFARAYALAAYKADDIARIRAASAGLSAIVDVEMGLHLDYCAKWGLAEADILAAPEAPATLAYTRFVLERGAAGDLLDLWVALAPCMIGYAAIGTALAARDGALDDANPYKPWIETYAGEEFQAGARAVGAEMDALVAERASEARWPALVRTFEQATRLEVGFWDMGWAGGG